MIGFALRLTLRGGREALTRLLLISVAVAIGVGLLLTTLAGINAVNSQNARYTGLETGEIAHLPVPGAASADPAWWRLSVDRFNNQEILRVDVAATGPNSPVPAGIPALPGPGQVYASPAMSRLLADTPHDQLAARYPGSQIGTIGDPALPAPNSLVIIVGRTPAQTAGEPGAHEITGINPPPGSCNGPGCVGGGGIGDQGIDLVLSVVTVALLFPVLIFIATATRLSAASREQRFAAMRLVGATPRQVTVISTVESTVAAAVGTAAGFGVFLALRPALAPIPFTGAPFFTSDLSLNPFDVLLVALGVPLGAAIAARLALRRVTISPLGVTRRVTPTPPHAWLLLPLMAGLAELGYFAIAGGPTTTGGQILAYLPGILVTMGGLVIAGPWLTMQGSRLAARRAQRPATLIAARRLADNPHAGFRAVSGLVLALFVTTTAIAMITSITANGGTTPTTPADRATLIDQLALNSGGPATPLPPVPATALDQLRATPGVTAVVQIHQGPPDTATIAVGGQPQQARVASGLVSCTDMTRVPALGRCPDGAQVAAIGPQLLGSTSATIQAAPNTTAAELPGLPVNTVVVGTDGSTAAIERARTVLDNALPHAIAPITIAERHAKRNSTIAAYQQLANVVIMVSLPIAGCTLAVSVVAGLNERKRPFSLLRLAGTPLRLLRRVIVLESAVPLLTAAVVSVGAGFLTAYLFLRGQLDETLHSPGPAFYGLLAVGVLASLAIIASTMPVLRRISGPQTARNE